MRRTLRILSAIGLFIFSFAQFGSNSAMASALGDQAFDKLATCVRSEDTSSLDVYFLIDTSGSLSKEYDGIPASDPTDQRAKIISASIKEFSQLNDKIKVQFALGTFDKDSPGGNGKYKGFGWVEANASNVEKQSRWALEKIPNYDSGAATNWLRGLQVAQQSLNSAPRIGEGGRACKAIIWFTDGALDVTSKFDSVSDSQAIKELCGVEASSNQNSMTSGIIPTFRRNQVTLIGVLLRPQVAKMQDVKKKAQVESRVSYFQPIVEGSGRVDGKGLIGTGEQEFNCGFSNDPTYASGAMLEAENVNELAKKFAELFMMISTGDLKPLYADLFEVENGISKVSAVIPSSNWKIELPNGEKEISSENPGNAFVNTVGEISTVSLDVTDKAHGTWKISHGNSPKPAIYFEAGLKIKLAKNLVFQSNGKAQKISGTILNNNGKAADLSVYAGETKMSVTPLDGSGQARASKTSLLQIDSKGNWSGEVLPFDGLSTSTLQIQLQVNTKKNSLPPIKQTFTVPLTIPGQYCKTPEGILKFSDLLYKKAPAVAKIKITGSDMGSCAIAFMAPNVVSDPIGRVDNSFKYELSDAQSGQKYKFGEYINIEQGSSREISISVDDENRVDGITDLRIPVKLNAAGAQVEIGKVLEANFMNKAVAKGKWLILFLVSFLGLLIPLGILYLVNSSFAKFRFKDIRYAVVPISVTISGNRIDLTPKGDRAELLLPSDFGYFENESGGKSVEVFGAGQNVAQLVTMLPRNPFGVIQGKAVVPNNNFIVSSEMSTVNDGLEAEVPLNPNKLFLMTVSPDSIQGSSDSEDLQFDGLMTVFLSEEGGSFDKQLPLLVEDIKHAPIWESFGAFLRTKANSITTEENSATENWSTKNVQSDSNDPWESGSISASQDDPWGSTESTSNVGSVQKHEKSDSKFSFGKKKSKDSKPSKPDESSAAEIKMDFDPDDPWA